MTDRADKNITFVKLKADPDLYRGKLVIFGGTISRITNMKRGTLIEIVQEPLDYWGKPIRTRRPGGLFLVFYSGYLDSMAYSPGRDITIAGEVAGVKLNELGDAEQPFPVLVSKEHKLWPKERNRPDQTQWWDPLYDPFNAPKQ